MLYQISESGGQGPSGLLYYRGATHSTFNSHFIFSHAVLANSIFN